MIILTELPANPDPLPRFDTYKDGCFVHSRCLDCPLPKCWLDMSEREKADQKAQWRILAHLGADRPASVQEMALALGVTERTVFRYKARGWL